MLALAIVGCSGRTADESGAVLEATRQGATTRPLLVDMTEGSGLDFVHDPVRSGRFLFPEINGAGCALLDYDNDGWLDLYLVQSGRDLTADQSDASGPPNRLYRNLGGWRFEDVTQASGAGDTGYGQGVATGDIDNDGFVDIFVANVGGPSALLHNNGNGTFTDITEAAGLTSESWAIVPAFLDYDADGLLDLMVTNYVQWSVATDVACETTRGERDYCGPLTYRPSPSALYHNNGDGTFSDVSRSAGITSEYGAGMGIICADLDDDGMVDIYVANDAYPNQLWINQGDGTFVDRSRLLGVAVSGKGSALSSMGTNVEDLDDDGDLDIFTTDYFSQGSILYRHEDDGFFTDVSLETRLFHLTASRTGFGACFLDLGNDGRLAVYIGNGAAVMGGEVDLETDPYALHDTVLEWDTASQRFEDITSRVGPALDEVLVSRGVAVGDLDNDGAIDLLVAANAGPARILRSAAAEGNHWLMVRCIGPDGVRDHLGAKVLVTAGGRTRRRDVVVNYSYASASDPRLHFGLGSSERAERVVVEWVGGERTTWENVAADQVFVARHPRAPAP